MFVVKGLVNLLGGTIHITSKINKGTTVKVTIPCQKAETPIKQGSKKIVVYDDDLVIAEMASNMLVRLGHEIVERDGDIILTDMEMGELTGIDILASAGTVPVILMTGHSNFTAEKAMELGFEGFLPKPFTLEALREIFGEETNSSNSFWEEDEDEIRDMFRISTAENQLLLRQALADENFNKAQIICHKMLTMFILLGYPVDALHRMDAQREKAYDNWQNDVKTILNIKV